MLKKPFTAQAETLDCAVGCCIQLYVLCNIFVNWCPIYTPGLIGIHEQKLCKIVLTCINRHGWPYHFSTHVHALNTDYPFHMPIPVRVLHVWIPVFSSPRIKLMANQYCNLINENLCIYLTKWFCSNSLQGFTK